MSSVERDESVAAAVRRELDGMPATVNASAVALTALALAREIDSVGNSATSKSMCAARLVEAMEKLRAWVEAEVPPQSVLDEIAKRRERRLARGAAS